MGRARLTIPRDADNAVLTVDGKEVRLTNLRKVFWSRLGITKGDLLQYYADVAFVLLPHICNRAMVMKRYPHGADGDFFFMKRAPTPRPSWIETCRIDHGHGNVIDFPMVQDNAALLWVINLGCIDLNQWYATCDDVDRPDYLHFDLDPGTGASFDRVIETAHVVHEALDTLKMPSLVKTTGSKGLHVYVPIARGPVQKQVWTFAKALAQELAARNPALITGSTAARSGRAAACSSTTTRIAGAARSPRSTRRARVLKRPSRRRSRGRSSTRGFASRTSRSATCRRASRSSAICGSRCCRRAAGSTCRHMSESASWPMA